MAKVKESKYNKGAYVFRCPGCGNLHFIPTLNPLSNGAMWKFNGDLDKPTFSPSINEKTGKYVDPKNDDEGMGYICHFFVTDGKIQFCGDSTHEHKGKTMDLPEVDF